MRTLLVGFIVILAALVIAALPILFTGKTMLYAVAAGHPMVSQRATTIAAALAAASVVWRQMVYGVGA